jgi:excisionase family DNA binding protein
MTDTLLIQISKSDLQTLVGAAISDYFKSNPTPGNDESLMTIAEAAKFLNLAIPTVYGKVSKKEIPFHKSGKRLYFVKKELRDHISNPNR